MDLNFSTSAGPENQSTITQSFREQKQIEAFIRKKNLFKIIENVADTFFNKYQETKAPEDALAAVVVKIPFVYDEFFDDFIELFHLSVEEPVQFYENTKYSIFGIIRDLIKQRSSATGIKVNVDIDQFHLLLRFIGLPIHPKLLYDPSINCYRLGLSILTGILRAYADPEQFVLQAIWYCATGCTRNKIKTESLEAPICSSCSKQMKEYSKLRTIQKCYLLRIQLSRSVQTPRICDKIFEPIIVRAKDHTFDCELSLGTNYHITGFYDYRQSEQEFVAWNLIEY